MNKQWTIAREKKDLPTDSEKGGCCYVVEIDGNIKIGCTTNLRTRLSTITNHLQKYSDVKIGRFAYTEPHINYKENEKLLHLHFSSKRKEATELFFMSFDEFLNNVPCLKYETEKEGYEIGPADMLFCSLFPAYAVHLEAEHGAKFTREQIDEIVKGAKAMGSSFLPFY